MAYYRYTVHDRKYGALMYEDGIEAPNRTIARQDILRAAKRDTPGGRGRSARYYGFVPVSDYRITFFPDE